jgi:predicted transcriptional regulator
MTTREALYRLVDSIPEKQLDDARKALEPLADPVLAALANARYDDEPETGEERAAVAEGRAALDAGDFVTMEEVRRELGL